MHTISTWHRQAESKPASFPPAHAACYKGLQAPGAALPLPAGFAEHVTVRSRQPQQQRAPPAVTRGPQGRRQGAQERGGGTRALHAGARALSTAKTPKKLKKKNHREFSLGQNPISKLSFQSKDDRRRDVKTNLYRCFLFSFFHLKPIPYHQIDWGWFFCFGFDSGFIRCLFTTFISIINCTVY